MTLPDACLSGLAGAASVEIAELYLATRRINEFPWRKKGEARLSVYLFSVILRLALGVFAAWLCAQTGSLDVAGAVAAGIAAPKLLEQLGQFAAAPSPVHIDRDGDQPHQAVATAPGGPIRSESAEGGSAVVS
jgi:hypothetical protein